MTTHRFFHIETAQQLADKFRTARHVGKGWTRIQDRDFERETAEIRTMGQVGPQRIF
jgi:hypothetical protein